MENVRKLSLSNNVWLALDLVLIWSGDRFCRVRERGTGREKSTDVWGVGAQLSPKLCYGDAPFGGKRRRFLTFSPALEPPRFYRKHCYHHHCTICNLAPSLPGIDSVESGNRDTTPCLRTSDNGCRIAAALSTTTSIARSSLLRAITSRQQSINKRPNIIFIVASRSLSIITFVCAH